MLTEIGKRGCTLTDSLAQPTKVKIFSKLQLDPYHYLFPVHHFHRSFSFLRHQGSQKLNISNLQSIH